MATAAAWGAVANGLLRWITCRQHEDATDAGQSSHHIRANVVRDRVRDPDGDREVGTPGVSGSLVLAKRIDAPVSRPRIPRLSRAAADHRVASDVAELSSGKEPTREAHVAGDQHPALAHRSHLLGTR
jgi:hypothetical protein